MTNLKCFPKFLANFVERTRVKMLGIVERGEMRDIIYV